MAALNPETNFELNHLFYPGQSQTMFHAKTRFYDDGKLERHRC